METDLNIKHLTMHLTPMKTHQSQNSWTVSSAYDRTGRRELTINRLPKSSVFPQRSTFRSFVRKKLAVNFASDAVSEFKPVIWTVSCHNGLTLQS